jgi:cell division protein FtsZ
LLLVQGASDLGLHEIDDAARLVQEAVHPEANIIFGATIEDTLGDEVRITVIAAGFDGGEPKHRKFEAAAMASVALAAAESTAMDSSVEQEEPELVAQAQDSEIRTVDAPAFEFAQAKTETRQQSLPGSFGDDLDLPEFFR